MLGKILNIQRPIFGLALAFFGLNGFFHFMSLPHHTDFAGEFMQALEGSGYLMPAIALIELTAGCALILNRGVNLALMSMLPISLNIFAFHAFHAPIAIIPASMILGINLFQLMMRTSFENNAITIRSAI